MKDLEAVALEAIVKTGKILQEGFYTEFTVRQKTSPNDLVTSFDLQAEHLLKETIKKKFPSHAFWGEEEGIEGDIEKETTWIIDPIDGTWNFAKQIPSFCTSISAYRQGEVLLTLCFDPIANELFVAKKGEGAFMNGKRIHVSSTSNIHTSGISVRALIELDHLHQAAMIRRSGSSLLDMCYVAKGALDGFIEWNLSVWDFAATTLLIQEAGGKVTDQSGNPPHLQPGKKYTIVATNGLLHQELLAWISTAKR